MEKFDPYQFVQDKKEYRPFNKDGIDDGSFNYVHETYVWDLIEKLKREYENVCKIT